MNKVMQQYRRAQMQLISVVFISILIFAYVQNWDMATLVLGVVMSSPLYLLALLGMCLSFLLVVFVSTYSVVFVVSFLVWLGLGVLRQDAKC